MASVVSSVEQTFNSRETNYNLAENTNYPLECKSEKTVFTENFILQSIKAQDFYWNSSNDAGELVICCDGHGSNIVIDKIRAINFDIFMKNLDFLKPEDIIKEVQSITNTPDSLGKINQKSSGSTITVIIINDNKIKIAWLGDSQVLIFKQDKLYMKTRSHNFLEDKEGIMGKRISHSYSCEVNSNGDMQQLYKPYIIQNEYDICAITRALGHGNISFNEPESIIIDISKEKDIVNIQDLRGDISESNSSTLFNNQSTLTKNYSHEWKVIVASDGVWDVIGNSEQDLDFMMKSTAQNIGLEASYRWSPEYIWKFYPDVHGGGDIFETSFKENDRDDIVVSTIEIN